MYKEPLGALIDAIYAIALTILVLDLPKPESALKLVEMFPAIRDSLINYSLSFLLLFNFWFNHRNINDLIGYYNRLTLWLSGLSLLFICLIPYATFMLHSHGDSELIDTAYIVNCLIIDALIHIILLCHCRQKIEAREDIEAIQKISNSRKISTTCFIVVTFIAIVSPIPNRNILVVVPLLMIFEKETVTIGQKFSSFTRKIRRAIMFGGDRQ
jgi:uncharacterized membrane protein